MTGANINDRWANLEGISKKEHISIDLVSGKDFRESADLTWVLELGSVLQKRKKNSLSMYGAGHCSDLFIPYHLHFEIEETEALNRVGFLKC